MRPFANHCTVLAHENISVTTAPFRRYFDFSTCSTIIKVTDNFKPNLVMTWMSRASAMTPKSKAIHIARLGGYYDLKYYKNADYLVGNTRHIVDYFHQQGWDSARTRYLPNFPDLPKTGKMINRQHFNTPNDVPLLLSLGRFHDDKAFDVLIKALASIPSAYLWLGGEGERESMFINLARNVGVYDRIRFIGWHDHISPFYEACDIYICPSRVEPLGNVILEAWAHHKPVIAADSHGPKGLITPHHNGLIVPKDNSDKLSDAINLLLQDKDLCHRLAQGGYDTYQQHFTEQAVIDAYLNFFNDIMPNQQGSS